MSYTHGSSLGKLLAVTYSGGSQGDYYGYDVLGRVTTKYQRLGTTNYQVQASYNLAGAVTGETYPSSHTVSYTYDAAGRPNNFTGNLGDGASRNYVTGTTVYNARGQMTEEQFGTGTPLFHRQRFNNRGQMYEAVLGTATTDAGLATINRGRLQNFYNTNYTVGNDGANNNGNLYLQKHFVPKDESLNEWVSSSEYYSYDALNRVTSDAGLGETYLSATYQQTSPYTQSYSYDRYGNRTIDQPNTWVKDGTVWVEDALPTGATALADGGDSWNWVTSSPSPYSGTKSSQSNLATGEHQHYFTGATATMSVSTGDKLYAYIFIDSSNLPNEVMLQWHENGSWEHRAYWGGNNIQWGTNNTDSRRSMGALPASGRWVRLEVPANVVGLEGKTVDGMAFTLNNGKATWDRAGKSPLVNGGINNAAYSVSTTNNNQLVPPSGVMHYDAAGNLDQDTFTKTGVELRDYDAENRMTAVYNNNTVLQDSYYYDGKGKRVRRVLAGTETWQVYGINGELVAEYGAAAPSTVQKEYGYRGGQLLITADSGGMVKWLVTDQLGTLRMVVDKSGDLNGTNGIVRHDYLPFGEEIGAGVGIRATNYGYGTDTVRQKFVGYERDSESGLDYAQARYYTNVQGRFTSPDEPLIGQQGDDPQTWNLYAYTSNNPLNRIDPDGRRWFRKVGEILPVWVDPNEDGTYTSPGEGWEAFVPTFDYDSHGVRHNRFSIYSPDGTQAIEFGENPDGSGFISAPLATGKVIDQPDHIIMAVDVARALFTLGNALRGAVTEELNRRATTGATRAIQIVERNKNVVIFGGQSAKGAIEVIAEVAKIGTTLVMKGAHIEG